MQGHVLAHFIDDEGKEKPRFPFLCLTVSGGHSQIVLVKAPLEMEVIGQTIDDAAGEAFDKSAKLLGFLYPGGPLIDKHAKDGDPEKFTFAEPRMKNYDYSFSGLKTSILYFLQAEVKKDKDFIENNLNDLCASIQSTIISILLKKLKRASRELNIKEIAIAGGVSANSGLRYELGQLAKKELWNIYLPRFEYCTDNAAMIAITGKYLFEEKRFASQNDAATPKWAL
jgi:N6-L-threonylcarbamoyladenine synthase